MEPSAGWRLRGRRVLPLVLLALSLERWSPAASLAGHWQPCRLAGPGAAKPSLWQVRRSLPLRQVRGGQDGDANHAATLLREETRLLRETQEVLIEEMRLLRQALRAGAQAGAQAEEGVLTAPMPLPTPVPVPVPDPAPSPPAAPPVAEAPVPVPIPVPVPAPAPVPVPAPVRPPPKSTMEPQVASAPMPAAPSTSGTPAPATPGSTAVKVISAGHACGNAADFFLEEKQIPVSIGPAARRGLNIVVVDPSAGRILSARCYDIWGNAVDENRRLARDLKALPEGHVVLVALKDSGMENIDNSALAALRDCGSTLEGRLSERESYALIGSKGGEAVMERRSDRMIMLEATLPFKLQSRLSSWTPPQTRSRVAAPGDGTAVPRTAPPPPPPPAPQPQPAGPSTAAPMGGAGGPGRPNPERPVAMIEEIQERIRAKRLGQTPGAQRP